MPKPPEPQPETGAPPPDRFLAHAVVRVHVAEPNTPEAWIGRELGPWTLVAPLGEGGMASVYLARRSDGLFEREVAIKIARSDLDASGLRRFDQERRVLAHLEHPGIARLYDGGITAEGRPFLVLERVDGEPIDRYCEREQASIDRRVELVLHVAEALAMAHEGGVIHRDIKPRNVLVDAGGRAVLLDFGIAKLLEPPRDGPAATRSDLRPMTPLWASPEQVRGDPLTPASDVYSLGLLLFHCLCGALPYRLGGGSLAEIESAILEQVPEPPSRVLKAGARSDNAPAVSTDWRRARGALDAIVATALSKEASVRYPTASELAADLARWRSGQPVLARRGPGSRFRRFIGRRKRHGPTLLVAAAIMAALGAGLGSWLHFEDRLRFTAQSERARERELDLLLGLEPLAAATTDPEILAHDLEEGLRRVRTMGDSALEAEALLRAARVLRRMGRLPRAIDLAERATFLYREERGGRALPTVDSEELLATLLQENRDYERAGRLFRHVLHVRATALGPLHPDVLLASNNLGMLLWETRSYVEAERLLSETLDLASAELGEDHAGTITVLGNLALVMQGLGRLEEAEPLHRRELAAMERLYGGDHPHWATSAHNLSVLLRKLDRPDEALDLGRQALAVRERRFGPEHPSVAASLNHLGMTQFNTFTELEHAERLVARALEIRIRALPADHPDLAKSQNDLEFVRRIRALVATAETATTAPGT